MVKDDTATHAAERHPACGAAHRPGYLNGPLWNRTRVRGYGWTLCAIAIPGSSELHRSSPAEPISMGETPRRQDSPGGELAYGFELPALGEVSESGVSAVLVSHPGDQASYRPLIAPTRTSTDRLGRRR